MCHRLLRFVRHTACGHNSFQGDSVIDCRSRECKISSHHPSPCNPCTCRRYYGYVLATVGYTFTYCHVL
ncbi:hypothetical protein EDC04DRAFT_2688928 [Pisolithus marmoratus]|nr:hypothetical protein EDC04DRAFT_2688928 [Pisolithus marmoratus]